MILVVMDGVAIRWVRQETLPGAAFYKKKKTDKAIDKIEEITLVATFVCITQIHH